MQKPKTLLQENDILAIVEGLHDTFPRCSIKDISTAEEYIFNCKLGKDFYKELKEAVCCYECSPYVPNTTYNEGDVVAYKGALKIALETTDTIPSTKGKWDNAPKFCGEKAECLNYFWCHYLRDYLAWYVMCTKALGMGSRFEDNGSHVKVFNPENSVPAGDGDLRRKEKFYNMQVEMSWKNMCEYAQDKECLSNFMKFDKKCCGTKRKRRQRWN